MNIDWSWAEHTMCCSKFEKDLITSIPSKYSQYVLLSMLIWILCIVNSIQPTGSKITYVDGKFNYKYSLVCFISEYVLSFASNNNKQSVIKVELWSCMVRRYAVCITYEERKTLNIRRKWKYLCTYVDYTVISPEILQDLVLL